MMIFIVMKAVILAGGLGTRISEETYIKPKPMIEIGGMPLLWHIMKTYSFYGINDFIICCGYKAEVIKEYFNSFDSDTWNVQLVDTGLDTMTGGRLKKIQNYVNDETFCFTYGDGVSNIDLRALLSYHKSHGKVVTLSGVRPPSMFGEIIQEGFIQELTSQ